MEFLSDAWVSELDDAFMEAGAREPVAPRSQARSIDKRSNHGSRRVPGCALPEERAVACSTKNSFEFVSPG